MITHRQPHVQAVIAGILCLATLARGTSIVILSNPTEVVVAADSKWHGSDEQLCKIFKVGSVYWAMSGVDGNNVTKYDVASIVRGSYVPGQPVAKMLDNFMRAVPEQLTRALLNWRQDPHLFETIRYHPLEIAFWGFEDGHPVIAHVFYTTKVVGDTVTVNPYDKDVVSPSTGEVKGALLGVQGSIHQYIETRRDWQYDLERSARQFVNLSVKESPETVGPPISELIMYTDGSEYWVTHDDACHGKLRSGNPPIPLQKPKR